MLIGARKVVRRSSCGRCQPVPVVVPGSVRASSLGVAHLPWRSGQIGGDRVRRDGEPGPLAHETQKGRLPCAGPEPATATAMRWVVLA